MNQQQRAAALRLLAALHEDADAKRSTVVYGDWLKHLTDHLEDELREN